LSSPSDRASRHVPARTTSWASVRGEPPATVVITWAVDQHDTTIVDLTGDMCTVTAKRVGALFAEVAAASAGDVAIDASAVTFIDSAGLSLLLATQDRLAERGRRCRIVSPSRPARRLFELVGLDDRLRRGVPVDGHRGMASTTAERMERRSREQPCRGLPPSDCGLRPTASG